MVEMRSASGDAGHGGAATRGGRKSWRHRVAGAFGAATAALGLVISTASPAAAWTDSELSWSACGWFDLQGPIRVQVDPNYNYPAPSQSPEGHYSSYPDRIRGAVNTWSGVFNNAPKWKHTLQVTTGVAQPEIVLRNHTPNIGDGKTYLGYTFVQRRVDGFSGSDFTNRCPYKSTTIQPMKYARIETAIRGDFFTQGNEWRAYWENKNGDCPNRSAGAPYSTCSKKYDFEAVMLHELGHALGQPHPSEPSSSGGETRPTENNAARCWDYMTNATMCRSQNDYWSSGRTLEDWDIQSFYRHITIGHY
jgi:hypothetical protein